MKKLIAISLLSLHLFSLTVCFLAHFIAVYRSDRFFEKQISRGLYSKEDLTEIRIPVNMPGMADWLAYADMYGEVRFANTAYNYVKIKMTHNAIYLLCIPNYKTTRLCGKNIIHAENIPDIPVSQKQRIPFSKLPMTVQSTFAFQNIKITVLVKQVSVLLAEPKADRLEFTLEIPQPPPKSSLLV